MRWEKLGKKPNFHRTKGFPLVTRWKIYSPQLFLLRKAGSLSLRLTYPRHSSESRNRIRFTITHSRNTGSIPRIHRQVGRVLFPSRFLPVSFRELSELTGASSFFHASFISPAGDGLDSYRRVVLIHHQKIRSPAFRAAGVIMTVLFESRSWHV
jgi:hypothetical protein